MRHRIGAKVAPMERTPTEAVAALLAAKWSEAKIGKEVDANQSTIHRIAHGADPSYSLGKALVALADRELSEASETE